jgi:hypothetical protein
MRYPEKPSRSGISLLEFWSVGHPSLSVKDKAGRWILGYPNDNEVLDFGAPSYADAYNPKS